MPALHLFSAGRQQRIYTLPPYTQVLSLDFDDDPFNPGKAPHACALRGGGVSYLDEVVTDDRSSRLFVCSDTDHCRERIAAGHKGRCRPKRQHETLLSLQNRTNTYGARQDCKDVTFELWPIG